MRRKIPRLAWVAAPLGYLLYFYGLTAAGLVGPDEPRYASIGREMARSGDWITPRLWGAPFFEKPVLLYWMTGAAFRLGIGPDLAPRLPVAAMAVAFLIFYWWILWREFGCRAAWLSTLILATTGGWWIYSQVGHMDLPFTATFSAAMLLTLPWISRGDGRYLPAAAALLGLAALAKTPAALILALPAFWWFWRQKHQEKFRWLRLLLIFLAVAAPWYALCFLRNGPVFFADFIWKHNVERFVSGAALGHGRPVWYYLEILPALLLPWTALAPLLARRSFYREPRRAFLFAWAVWVLVFFSVAANKLPGYILPALPALAALFGLALDEEQKNASAWLPATALLLVAFPIAAALLPAAIAVGLTHAPPPPFQWVWLLPAGVAALAWMAEVRGKRLAAVFCVALGAIAGTVYLKRTAGPELDRLATARSLWNQIAGRQNDVCVESLERNWRYGLNYYSVEPLPDCNRQARPLRIVQAPGAPPGLVRAVDRGPAIIVKSRIAIIVKSRNQD